MKRLERGDPPAWAEGFKVGVGGWVGGWVGGAFGLQPVATVEFRYRAQAAVSTAPEAPSEGSTGHCKSHAPNLSPTHIRAPGHDPHPHLPAAAAPIFNPDPTCRRCRRRRRIWLRPHTRTGWL